MSSPSEFHNAFDIRNSSHITVTGDGTIDGQGKLDDNPSNCELL
jgi:hypothetical protein